MKFYLIDIRVLGDYTFKVIEMKLNKIKEDEVVILFSNKDPSRILQKVKAKRNVDIIAEQKTPKEWIVYIIARPSRIQNYIISS
ncbi:hypothetical protein [Saccharolobus caldissimus]|uniref:Uncharacterized protein n=1 Tax=Saccharolobus caldissimus TaxID=1702097 RepID=A0AAQ4CRA2_9CREN|nr:hypothetical protein [Saccharolobus caldissimus]BDB98333.1 hypothetical protein SACC_13500 [Saccharolobus caldissimus]